MEAVLEEAGESKSNLTCEKYLSFMLEDCSYGIEIPFVSEIIEVLDISPIPKSPKYLKGLVNLRGKVFPVLDLRLKLEMPEKEYDEKTCIIVVNSNQNKNEQFGLIVDKVSEVLDIKNSEIDNSFNSTISNHNNILEGIGNVKNKIIVLLNILSLVNLN